MFYAVLSNNGRFDIIYIIHTNIKGMNSMTTGSIKTGDGTLEYFSFGSGSRTLLILPGLGIQSVLKAAHSVESAYGCFSKDYTVYVADRRNPVPKGFSVEGMADDTYALLNELGVEKADVFGASMGGMIAQTFALRYPERVHSLILGSTLSRPNQTATRVMERWMDSARKRDSRAMAKQMIGLLYTEKLAAQWEMIAELMFAGVTDADYDRFIEQAKAVENFDVYDELPKLGCPVFVIGVDGDKVLTGEASREIARKLGCDCYMYGSEYAHCVFDEAPDYKQRMMDWLDTTYISIV